MSVLTDPKLQYALPMENELRVTYPFANLYITFPTKPFSGNQIYFPAYLKKIDDVFTPEFTPIKVFGRTDPIPTYKGTTRKLSVSFDLPAFNEFDANEILRKLNILVKNLYPGYVENRGQQIINSPPLIRVKFANLINSPTNTFQGLLGYVDALNLSHNFTDMSPFVYTSEITALARDTDNDTSSGYIFAKAYSLSLGFTALHEQVVGWDDKTGNFKERFKDTYPYGRIPDYEIGEINKPTWQRAVTSNLRGTITQDPATARGTTLILGGLSL